MGQHHPTNDREDHGEKGPIPPQDLEARNTERSKEARHIIIGKVEIAITDGGIHPSEVSGAIGDRLEDLLRKAIVLVALVLLTVLVWRIGSIINILDLILS